MVNFRKLQEQAKNVVEKRGGTEGLKGDLAQLKGIAKEKGSLKDKAKEAAAALKEPGSKDEGSAATAPTPDEHRAPDAHRVESHPPKPKSPGA